MDMKDITAILVILSFIIFVIFPVFVAGDNVKYSDAVVGGAVLIGIAIGVGAVVSLVFWAIYQLGGI